ncbi:dermonecrotic toxin domain-containing protein [Pseudomonas moraviensis]|uniref:dermonecrotic toxin domain-containing protein n=1 Tax=Pseudomonas moraviensis TaxID=321662 RepID=UPI0020C5ADAF|nr:DUF6543 domain-containing protein [Pseudomonas moraviensis]
MSPDPVVRRVPENPAKPSATDSLHAPYLEAAIPQWLLDASARRRAEFKQTKAKIPTWYRQASLQQRKTLNRAFQDSIAAQTELDNAMSAFKDIDDFARPLLVKALKHHFKVQVDVDKTLLCLKRPLLVGIFEIEVGAFEVLKLPMLQAALHNFESRECLPGAFHSSSGFIQPTTKPDTYELMTLNLTVPQFLRLCRHLDIGRQYQTYLKTFFHPTDQQAETKLRQLFIASQKAAMRAAAEHALLAKDIRPEDHKMILSVINGEIYPRIDGKRVWFRDLSLMRHRTVGCVAFSIADLLRGADAVIVYVPNDPVCPLKRYTDNRDIAAFEQRFTYRDPQHKQSADPTPYQRFFSQFMPYEKYPSYFSQFVRTSAGFLPDLLSSPWIKALIIIGGPGPFIEIREMPPARPSMEPEPEPYIALSAIPRKDQGPWSNNTDLWTYLYEQHRDKVFADARSHAVATGDVDIRVRDAKLAALLQIGFLR